MIDYGNLNGHSVGRILKETVRRAMVEARSKRLAFETTTKMSYSGTMDDVFTDADKACQEVYLRAFAECFPGYGVIAEEGQLSIHSLNGMYFTVDPIDGTKAYIRRQSHGISTMVALVHAKTNKVLSAFIGDISTGEIFGYRPGSDKVWRITDLTASEALTVDVTRRASESHALLRDPLDRYTPATSKMMKLFKNYEVMGSSIGTWAARLWKQEVQALVLPAGFETPWDSTPVIGISQKLGYEFYRGDEDGSWVKFIPMLPQEPERREYDVMIAHPSVFNLDLVN